jgi:hypothetical protein
MCINHCISPVGLFKTDYLWSFQSFEGGKVNEVNTLKVSCPSICSIFISEIAEQISIKQSAVKEPDNFQKSIKM